MINLTAHLADPPLQHWSGRGIRKAQNATPRMLLRRNRKRSSAASANTCIVVESTNDDYQNQVLIQCLDLEDGRNQEDRDRCKRLLQLVNSAQIAEERKSTLSIWMKDTLSLLMSLAAHFG